ncbi:hypothetical protein J437_LFUL001024 [Ladona fulva]|uniref:PiggyBac transposable element-derived protein domain-containing protein n=1 Tax=Ladona fulva TaxID=123851 RepID=A0A8K0P639_LADFU|nr:hypothetical protein J437_LFUL001024 [Ladona fulva]
MAQNLTEREIEVFLESDSEAEINPSESSDGESEDECPLAQGPVGEWIKGSRRTGNRSILFSGEQSGFRREEVLHIERDSSPGAIFLLFFTEIIHLLVEETKTYYRQYVDSLGEDEGSSLSPDVTTDKMFSFLAFIQMGHDLRDTRKDYWSTLEQFHMPFYRNVMPPNRFMHILKFLHFSDKCNQPDKNDDEYDRFWKLRNIFENLNDSYAKFYKPGENLTVDEVESFSNNTYQKNKLFGVKICDSTGYTYDMVVYLGKDKKKANTTIYTYDMVVYLGKAKKKGYLDDVRDTCYWEASDMAIRILNDLTAITWRDKRDLNLLTNIHNPPADGNFCDEQGNAIKPVIIQDYNRNMGFVDKGERMANKAPGSGQKKFFFHLLDVTIRNSYIISESLSKEVSHRMFRLMLVRDLLENIGNRLEATLRGRPNPCDTNITRLEAKKMEHWPEKNKQVAVSRVFNEKNHQAYEHSLSEV